MAVGCLSLVLVGFQLSAKRDEILSEQAFDDLAWEAADQQAEAILSAANETARLTLYFAATRDQSDKLAVAAGHLRDEAQRLQETVNTITSTHDDTVTAVAETSHRTWQLVHDLLTRAPTYETHLLILHADNIGAVANALILQTDDLRMALSMERSDRQAALDRLVQRANQEVLVLFTAAGLLLAGSLVFVTRKWFHQHRLSDHLQEEALTDSLTGIGNYRRLQLACERHYRARKHFAIIMVDIDDFKRINDKFGHLFGDSVLKRVSQEIATQLRPKEQVYRYGGEEFAVVIPGSDLVTTAQDRAEWLRGAVELLRFPSPHQNLRVTISLGIAVYDPVQANNPVRDADDALYVSKRLGKNRVTWFAPGSAVAAARLDGAT